MVAFPITSICLIWFQCNNNNNTQFSNELFRRTGATNGVGTDYNSEAVEFILAF